MKLHKKKQPSYIDKKEIVKAEDNVIEVDDDSSVIDFLSGIDQIKSRKPGRPAYDLDERALVDIYLNYKVSYRELSKDIGVSPSTICRRTRRAIKKLEGGERLKGAWRKPK